jgi:hypothetical protein
MDKCQVEGCNETVSKPGYSLCFQHWKDEKDGLITQCQKCGKWKDNDYPLCKSCYSKEKGFKSETGNQDDQSKYLSATKIGDEFGLSSQKINQILAELGWIKKDVVGWLATEQGFANGALQREHSQSGGQFVLWPVEILKHKALIWTVKDYKGEIQDITKETDPKSKKVENKESSFRVTFPASERAQDGHMVRSRGEMLIDNYLYVAGLAHAYERRLPIEEECYCDFYLPKGNVYIEFWGLEEDKDYVDRKKIKLELYKKYNLNLIELKNEHISNLDDHLPRMLLKFKIDVT